MLATKAVPAEVFGLSTQLTRNGKKGAISHFLEEALTKKIYLVDRKAI